MENEKIVKEQLRQLINGGNAHLPYKNILKDYPLEIINKTVNGISYTPWQLLEHIKIAQDDILEFIRNPKYKEMNWPEDYWVREKSADKQMWADTCSEFFNGLDEVEKIINDPEADFYAPLPHAPKYNIYREILLIADHNAYHFGQLMLIRKLLTV